MNKHRFGVGAVMSAFRLASATALALCLVQCSAEQHSDLAGDENLGSVSQALEHCGSKPCASPADCLSGMPVCALSSGATCFNNTDCIYKLNTGSSSCPCIEHDVRLCTVAGSGAAGVQICTKVTSTSTTWAACVACPSCTP